MSSLSSILLLWCSLIIACYGFRVPISDTDNLREVCSGMYGGKEAYIDMAFDESSSGQVALVIYEWSDVQYLGAQGDDDLRTYICTTSAVRSGLCTDSNMGGFITTYPEGVDTNATSIFTTPLRFSNVFSSIPSSDEDESVEASATTSAESAEETGSTESESEEESAEGLDAENEYEEAAKLAESVGDIEERRVTARDREGVAPLYTSPITYAVPKTGYYCVGIVPVTLVNSKRDLTKREATHAEYSGVVLFRNTFEGELPAVEYPKIGFYLSLSIVYFLLGCGWAYFCSKHHRELLPMQYYISGTIVFLVIEMLAQFAYYRYINKNGGGATSLAFLFVIAVLNAARNSLSFFLLLIVSMGLSVVTQSLGTVMTKVRILTALHFIFGVVYAVGTVQVEIDNASLLTVLLLIFPLSLTLTAFLMWIIVSLNGTILHLQARKQRYKLQMFQRLWRILVVSVIAVAAFFVVSSMSLSNRLDEDYTPSSWKYRWILLDGSLATIYLLAFAAIAYLWRPTRDNLQFSMSQELAQDEADADAEDYEFDALDLESGRGRGMGHQPLGQDDDDEEEEDVRKGLVRGTHGVGEENVVFAMGDDSDEEEEGRRSKGGYRDSEEAGGSRRASPSENKGKND
ncbi:major facilitator protein [Cryptococcus wingfieldii CBS 7118]|uniref:Major facilitator protein n=1 Tax=Cryptococcus wingfieldii CBS 7118 TaxID=1295528 RepID=A0A1E3JBK2_9TREE|nr:major facilitator protein [Cryptococcus wingfieldii CBS 7118]ODN97486.1 major facilitator protein [Cryptococcus wingfieldii CBS 7118]